ncbi:hypothetical protein JCM1841_000115 [Sporobolomyces salmonicolor]
MGAPFAPAPYGMLSSQWAHAGAFSPSSGYHLFRHQPHHHQRASFPSSSTSHPSPHYHPARPLPATSTSSYSWPSPEQARSSTWPVQHHSSDSTAPSAPYHDLPPSSTSHSQYDTNGQLSQLPHPDNDTLNFPIAQTTSSLPRNLETVEHHQQDATEEGWTQIMTWHIELLGGAFTVLSDHKKLEDKLKEAYAKDKLCKMAKENVESIPGWQLDPGSRFLYFED